MERESEVPSDTPPEQVAKILEEGRPAPALTVRDATAEQMFDELAYRAGVPTEDNDRAAIVCELRGPGEGPSYISMHGNGIRSTDALLRLLLSRVPPQVLVIAILQALEQRGEASVRVVPKGMAHGVMTKPDDPPKPSPN